MLCYWGAFPEAADDSHFFSFGAFLPTLVITQVYLASDPVLLRLRMKFQYLKAGKHFDLLHEELPMVLQCLSSVA